MSLSSLLTKIGFPMVALCIVVTLPGIGPAATDDGGSGSTPPTTTTTSATTDGHPWHG